MNGSSVSVPGRRHRLAAAVDRHGVALVAHGDGGGGEHPAVDLQHVGQGREGLARGDASRRGRRGPRRARRPAPGGRARGRASPCARRARRAAAPPASARSPAETLGQLEGPGVGHQAAHGQVAVAGARPPARAPGRHRRPRRSPRSPREARSSATLPVPQPRSSTGPPWRVGQLAPGGQVGGVARALHVVPGGGVRAGERALAHTATSRGAGASSGRSSRSRSQTGRSSRSDDSAKARCSPRRARAKPCAHLLDVVARDHRAPLGPAAAQALAALLASRGRSTRGRPAPSISARHVHAVVVALAPVEQLELAVVHRPGEAVHRGAGIRMDVHEGHEHGGAHAVGAAQVHLVAGDGLGVVGGHAEEPAVPAQARRARRRRP